MNDRKMSPRQVLYPVDDVCRLGLYVNNSSGKLFYATYDEHADNRINPEKVWLDENGAIHVKVERRLAKDE